ncbi:hypothetical protein BGY98DRAFT_450964 [Russula aff. rugulosa BPL654]|nr:hypothetical protein BGY98DRAFT_450964 [Russula aff. rugulosa BPL654]
MSKVFNVSDDFGKLLLEGWTPSDLTCPAESCRGIPLLRSPDGHNPVTWFCTSCKGDGTRGLGAGLSEQQHLSSPSLASSTHYSRSSTPPTEESHDPNSITFALPVETEESIRRRQQSDFASSEIGKRLLKGWAMLADECPRNTCYGIPLVRPPTAGRDKDPRKECVVCGTIYVTETEKKAQGRGPLVPGTISGSSREEITPSSIFVEGSSAAAKGKAKTSEIPAVPMVVASASPAVRISNITHPASALPATSSFTRESNPPLPTSPSRRGFSEPISTSDDILANSSKALETTLSALSQRLMLLSGQAILDPVTISQTADAIAKVGQALAVIKTLRHNQE